MKKDAIKSVVVLCAICLVVAALMALTNRLTSPVIARAEEKAEQEALLLVLPDAEEFEALSMDSLPDTVSGVFRDKAGAGYAILLSVGGYDSSKPISLAVGITEEGTVVKCHVISCTGETSGIGSRVSEAFFLDRFLGADASLDGVDTIAGATISSSAVRGAVADAFVAYEMAREVAK